MLLRLSKVLTLLFATSSRKEVTVSIEEQTLELVKHATPPVAVTGLTVFGYPLPDIVSILTIIYLLVHISYIISKWLRGK